MPDKTCAYCGKIASLSCGRCKSAKYCDRNCQTNHWPTHKDTCGQVNTKVIKEIKTLFNQSPSLRCYVDALCHYLDLGNNEILRVVLNIHPNKFQVAAYTEEKPNNTSYIPNCYPVFMSFSTPSGINRNSSYDDSEYISIDLISVPIIESRRKCNTIQNTYKFSKGMTREGIFYVYVINEGTALTDFKWKPKTYKSL